MIGSSSSAKKSLDDLSAEKTELLKLLRERKLRQNLTIQPCARLEGAAGHMPTSWAQQRLWFMDQLEGVSTAYVLGTVLRLAGDLNVNALHRVLNALMERHESLRTIFVNVGGEPHQEIALQGIFPLRIFDVSAADPADREAQVNVHKAKEAREKFDLGVGPLIRGRLIKTALQEHVLLITMHHIVSDGWSMAVFIREFAALYTAHCHGRPNPLEPLPIQYADYVNWQRQWLRGEALNRQLNYWRAQLAGATPQLELPTDRPRPAIQSYRGDMAEVVLDAQLSVQLHAIAERHGMTLFMVLCAGWTILLSRLSGQEDISVGTPVANRQRPELEGLIGFFVNTLVLRLVLNDDLSLVDLFQQVKDATLGAYDHQDVPFEKVVEVLQPQRTLNRNPLFQVMLVLLNTPADQWRLPGMNVTEEKDVYESSKFDLELVLVEKNDRIVGCVNYSTDLFDRQTIERWMASFSVLLSSMTSHTQSRISDLPILPTDQRRQIIESFNATAVDYPRDRLIHEMIEEAAARTPDAVAVVHDQLNCTYAQLNAKANQLAWHLAEAGIAADQLVGICIDRGLEMVVAMLAVWKAGGAYVPLDPSYPAERLASVLEDAAPRRVLIQARFRDRLHAAATGIIEIDADWSRIALRPTTNVGTRVRGVRSNNLAYVIYTSGSTGKPKGVMIEHRCVLSLWQGLEQIYRDSPGCERIAVNASFSFDASVKQFVQLLSGRTLVMVPQEVRLDASMMLDFFDAQQVDGIDCTPMQLKSWLAAGLATSDNDRPRLVLVGGEPIDGELWRSLAFARPTEFYNVYGPTESTVDTTFARLKTDERAPHIGRPMENRIVHILDRNRRPVPIGVAGEIYIAGAGVARGYLNRPELTAERFLSNPFSADPRARIYRTGDVARWRADGTIDYLGRNDRQVKIRGYRIELGEIEAQLIRSAMIREAAVIDREDGTGDKRLVAYVVLCDSVSALGSENVEALRASLKTSLPDYMVPSAFVVMQQLPLTTNGKLDRSALPAPDVAAYASQSYQAPEGRIEVTLAEIWQELLQVDRIGRHDNFFELGGHSLHGMKLIAKVEERLGTRLSVVAVFQYPTVREMAAVVSSKSEVCAVAPESTEPELRSGPREAPLSFAQRGYLHFYRLLGQRYDERAVKMVAAALRLQGQLDLQVFRQASAEIVRRHDALRIRIVPRGSILIQEISDSAACEVEIVDLRGTAVHLREMQTQRIIDQFILEPIDLSVGPVAGMRLLKFSDTEHVLLLGMAHEISDGTSLFILTRDLLTAYMQISRGRVVSLPAIQMQFPEYAAWQRSEEQAWREKHGSYWAERLAGHDRLRFPEDKCLAIGADPGWDAIPVRIDAQTKAALQEWSRQRQTTVAMSVFTAYVALVMRWCDVHDAVIQYVSNARATPKVENTIGFFASALHLRIEIRAGDTLSDLLKRVTDEYCSAFDHHDFSYLSTLSPTPGYLRNSHFNWTPRGSKVDLSEFESCGGSISYSPIEFVSPTLSRLGVDSEPAVQLHDADSRIDGNVFFPTDRFTAGTMKNFARNFLMFVRLLLEQPEQRVLEVTLCE